MILKLGMLLNVHRYRHVTILLFSFYEDLLIAHDNGQRDDRVLVHSSRVGIFFSPVWVSFTPAVTGSYGSLCCLQRNSTPGSGLQQGAL
jgi:hypothetical protein